MLAKHRMQKWLRRAHKYLEIARTEGLPAAEKYAERFRDSSKILDRAIELISNEMAVGRPAKKSLSH